MTTTGDKGEHKEDEKQVEPAREGRGAPDYRFARASRPPGDKTVAVSIEVGSEVNHLEPLGREASSRKKSAGSQPALRFESSYRRRSAFTSFGGWGGWGAEAVICRPGVLIVGRITAAMSW
jgi:hypothetical protein